MLTRALNVVSVAAVAAVLVVTARAQSAAPLAAPAIVTTEGAVTGQPQALAQSLRLDASATRVARGDRFSLVVTGVDRAAREVVLQVRLASTRWWTDEVLGRGSSSHVVAKRAYGSGERLYRVRVTLADGRVVVTAPTRVTLPSLVG